MQIKLQNCTIDAEIRQSGQRPWIVFSHSLAANNRMWTRQVKILSDRFNVIAYDMRGHGKSPPAEPPLTISDLAADVIDLMNRLDIESAHHIGLSLGGGIGIALGLDFPTRIESVIACNCRVQIPSEAAIAWRERMALVAVQGIEPIVEPTLARWLNPEFIATHPREAAGVAP